MSHDCYGHGGIDKNKRNRVFRVTRRRDSQVVLGFVASFFCVELKHLIGISMIGSDQKEGIGCETTLIEFFNACVKNFDSLHGGGKTSAVANHIAIGKVESNEVIFLLLNRGLPHPL